MSALVVPAAWVPMIADYLTSLAANGQRPATIKLRREQLGQLARALDCAPGAVTADRLVGWYGQQTHWAIPTRRSNQETARGFFAWAYKHHRVPVDLSDAVPKVRTPKASPRPASDQAWRTALMAADTRITLAIRLAGEAGLRRSEVAQLHTRDLLDGIDGAQLLVHGKGGKKRVVPISDGLAKLVRQGAAGHTSGAPADGYLFPGRDNGHLSPRHLGELVAATLPSGYTMHALRHRFATRAYRGTGNLRAVQVLLGHESVATTEIYTAVSTTEVRAAMTAAIAD
jgi:integrase